MRSARNLLLLAGLTLTAAAHADQVLYHNDFEAGIIDPQWGATARLEQAGIFTKFVGRYSENIGNTLNNSVSLTLPAWSGDDTGNPGGGSATPYTLSFDFYAIDSWDGNATLNGPDLFEVIINGVNLFSYTFSNSASPQSYPNLPTIGPSFLNYNAGDKDSIYRSISIPFSIGAATQYTIKWRSNGLQGAQDESWGIDNVNVTYAVPTPGSIALLGAAGLVLTKRRRR